MNPTRDLKITTMRNWAEVEELRGTWEELSATQTAPTVFTSWEWSKSWWRAYGGKGRLNVLVVRRSEGVIVGIAPCYIARKAGLRFLRFIGANGDSGALDILARPDCEGEIWEAIAAWLADSRDWDILELSNIAPESRSARIVKEELRSRRFRVSHFGAPFCRIPLPSSWEEFVGGLSPKLRRSLNRTEERLRAEFEVVFRQCDSASGLPACLDRLFNLHSRRWAKKKVAGAFDEKRKLFYGELSRSLLEKGGLDVWELELSGRVVVVEFGCRFRGSRYALQSGFDPEYARFSVGQALESFLLMRSIERKDEFYDLMGGTHSYKLRWGAEIRQFASFRCARPWSLGGFALRVSRILKRNSQNN